MKNYSLPPALHYIFIIYYSDVCNKRFDHRCMHGHNILAGLLTTTLGFSCLLFSRFLSQQHLSHKSYEANNGIHSLCMLQNHF